MATGDKTEIEREVEKTITVTEVEREPGVVLELTLAEARALYAVTVRVGGSPIHSPRRLTDAIGAAVKGALQDYAAGLVSYGGHYPFAEPENGLARFSLSFDNYPGDGDD